MTRIACKAKHQARKPGVFVYAFWYTKFCNGGLFPTSTIGFKTQLFSCLAENSAIKMAQASAWAYSEYIIISTSTVTLMLALDGGGAWAYSKHIIISTSTAALMLALNKMLKPDWGTFIWRKRPLVPILNM